MTQKKPTEEKKKKTSFQNHVHSSVTVFHEERSFLQRIGQQFKKKEIIMAPFGFSSILT